MTKLKYEIWSNVAEDPMRFFNGYRQGNPMKKSWEGELEVDQKIETDDQLECLFMKFNMDNRPNGKVAHSLSVGDVVVLDGKAYAVQMMGFTPVPGLFKPVIGDYA